LPVIVFLHHPAKYEIINDAFKNETEGVQGCPLVMLGKVSGLEREKTRFESRGVLSLQEPYVFVNLHTILTFEGIKS